MSELLKAVIKVLQQVVVQEHPGAVEATIRLRLGGRYDLEIVERGGGKISEC